MKKIVISLHTGFCGMDTKEGWEVPDDISDAELDTLCWERAKEHAESYGIYPYEEYAEDGEISDEDLEGEDYSHNIEGSWKLYDPKKHDGHLTYGGNDKPSFAHYG